MFVCLQSVLTEYVVISDSPFFAAVFLPFRHRHTCQQQVAHTYFKMQSSPGVEKKSFKVINNLKKRKKM